MPYPLSTLYPKASGLYPGPAAVVPPPPTGIFEPTVETWRAVELHYADGQIKRFGPDERADADVAYSLNYDTQIPGGFGPGSAVLPRPPSLRADDAALFSHARVYGPGGRTYYEGRVSGIPQVGSEAIKLDLEGWSAHLDDDETFREIFIDRDLTRWKEPGIARQLWLISQAQQLQGFRLGGGDAPALITAMQAPWFAAHSEAVYDAGAGIKVARVAAGYQPVGISFNSAAPEWAWQIYVYDVEAINAGTVYSTANLRSTGGSVVFTPAAPLRYATLFFSHSGGGSGSDDFAVNWTGLSVVGDHGLTIRGTEPNTGFYGSDILAHALSRSAPMLNYTLGDSIETSSFVIPHMVFVEPVTIRQVVEQVTALGGATFVPNDWGVYDGREFFHRRPGTYGRTWRVRRDLVATPTSEGPESKERVGGMMVSYRDPVGATRSVGPPGSDADFESTDLLDSDLSNPANRLGRKWRHRTVGITDQAGALNIGRLLLAEANRLDWRGSVTIRGEATDDAGNTYPADQIRAGDQMVIEDGEDVSEHPISKTNYSHDDLANAVDIGAPPHSAEVLLAQLEAATDLTAA